MSVALDLTARISPRQANSSAVELHAVSVTFQNGGTEFLALDEISLNISSGKFIAVVGPSGCGKSTLLNVVSGIRKPTAGQVVHFGAPLQGLARGTGYVLQNDGLLAWKTVAENIGLPLKLQRYKPAEIQERVRTWLERTGLDQFAQAYPTHLSGGMRKRVALAQALIHHPKLVLMDEPLSALDVHTRAVIGNELMALWAKLGSTMLLVTHDLEEAITFADEVVVLTSRPSRVKAVYPIDLPRPRDMREVRLSNSFQRLYAAIWSDLREEVFTANAQLT